MLMEKTPEKIQKKEEEKSAVKSGSKEEEVEPADFTEYWLLNCRPWPTMKEWLRFQALQKLASEDEETFWDHASCSSSQVAGAVEDSLEAYYKHCLEAAGGVKKRKLNEDL